VLFLLAGMGQGILLVLLDYKKLGAKKRSELMDGAILFPFFTVVYCVTMCFGAFSKPKWNKVNRNKQAQTDYVADTNEEIAVAYIASSPQSAQQTIQTEVPQAEQSATGASANSGLVLDEDQTLDFKQS
jgi:hypothetical protein